MVEVLVSNCKKDGYGECVGFREGAEFGEVSIWQRCENGGPSVAWSAEVAVSDFGPVVFLDVRRWGAGYQPESGLGEACTAGPFHDCQVVLALKLVCHGNARGDGR